MTTNYDIDYKKVIKQSSGLHLRSYTVKKKMSKLIFAQNNSAGLLWSVRLRSACVPIHFLKVCCKKTFLLRCSPHVGRLHLLFITSWLYFSSKFQAGVQSAKKASLCVWAFGMCGLLLFLFVRMHVEPRFSFIPAETFPNIWEHRPLVLAGECVVSAYSQIHNAHMNRLHLMVEGGGGVGEGWIMQALRFHYNSN